LFRKICRLDNPEEITVEIYMNGKIVTGLLKITKVQLVIIGVPEAKVYFENQLR